MHRRLRYRRDGQTDRQTAFQLYIVEIDIDLLSQVTRHKTHGRTEAGVPIVDYRNGFFHRINISRIMILVNICNFIFTNLLAI